MPPDRAPKAPSTIIEDDEILPAEVINGTKGTGNTPVSSEGADYSDYAIVATQMADADGAELDYLWTQTAGQPVQLLDATELTARFIAPLIDEDKGPQGNPRSPSQRTFAQ